MHYYSFNIGDYLSHTLHLDLVEDSAYRRMIDYCYLHESHLPNSVEQIAKKIRMRTHCEEIANVLEEFFELDEYGYFQPRIMEEIAAYKEKSAKAKRSAEARWSKKPKEPNANALQADSESNAKHKPLNIKQETVNNTIAASDSLLLAGKNKDFELTKEMQDKYTKAYPLINCSLEFNKIAAWCDSNKSKRKTPAGMPRFINSWLSRANDKPSSSALNFDQQKQDYSNTMGFNTEV